MATRRAAAAALSHSACARFCGTDPLITGRTRRGLARDVGSSNEFGGTPEARWMRAMTFERLVRDERFARRCCARTSGAADLPAQRYRSCKPRILSRTALR